MPGLRWLRLTVLVCACLLGSRNPARAGPWLASFWHPDAQVPSYCPARYWTPGLARMYDCLCGPRLSPWAPDRHPEIPPGVAVLQYPRWHPAPYPGQTIVSTPTPPQDSRTR
jgi:hypothetical protein